MSRRHITLAFIGLLFATTPVAAHGGEARAQLIRFDPTDPARIAFVTTRALVLGDGDTFHWVCRSATDSTFIEDPRLAFTPSGALLSAGFRGLQRGTGAGCDWSAPSATLDATVVIEVVRADDGTLYALTSSGSSPNDLFRSRDDGRTWDDLGAPGATLLLDRVIARGERIVLSGTDLRGDAGGPLSFVYVSDDGGESYTRHAFSLGADERALELLEVDPAHPARFFARVRGREELGASLGDRLVVSEDGGVSWDTVLRLGTLHGFALDPDTGELWVGGASHPELAQGLWASMGRWFPGAELAHHQPATAIECLAHRVGPSGPELWACGEEAISGFGVARSRDGGESFETVWTQADLVGPAPCGESQAGLCAGDDEDLVVDLALPIDFGSRDGGGCTATGRPDSTWLVALVLVGARRRRP